MLHFPCFKEFFEFCYKSIIGLTVVHLSFPEHCIDNKTTLFDQCLVWELLARGYLDLAVMTGKVVEDDDNDPIKMPYQSETQVMFFQIRLLNETLMVSGRFVWI